MGGWPRPSARRPDPVPSLTLRPPLPRRFPTPDGQRQAEPMCLEGEVPRDQHNLGAWRSFKRQGLLRRGL